MDSSEEKFFQDLVNYGSEEPESPLEVELAKASAAATSRERSKKMSPSPLPVNEGPEGQLTIDVYQTQDEIVIQSAIAGVRAEDLDVSVSNDSVTIRGSRHRDAETAEEDYLYQECYWGRFARSVILPQEVNPDDASVKFKNGILTIRLPKLNRQRTKKLKVKIE